jgi:hypothetical protein
LTAKNLWPGGICLKQAVGAIRGANLRGLDESRASWFNPFKKARIPDG